MRRVKLLRNPRQEEAFPFAAEATAPESARAKLERELAFYRHHCGEGWFEELLEETGLGGKRLNPSRARKLLLQAVRKRLESE